MQDVKWIKIITNIFDDEKIRLIETLPDADTVLIIWFKLLIMAGKVNNCGMVYLTPDLPYNDEMLATVMRRPVNTVRLAITEFEKLGMIKVHEDVIKVLNWDRHQNSEALNYIREQNRVRAERFRAKAKSLTDNSSRKNNGEKTDSNALDKNRLDKIRIDKNIYILLDLWNVQEALRKHNPETIEKNIKKKHLDVLGLYDIENIKQAIINYNVVCAGKGEFWFTYRSWTFLLFLERGLEKFLPDADPINSFRIIKKDTRPYNQRNSFLDTLPEDVLNQLVDEAGQYDSPIAMPEATNGR